MREGWVALLVAGLVPPVMWEKVTCDSFFGASPSTHLHTIHGGLSTQDNAVGSSSEIPVTVSDAAPCLPTATAACTVVAETLGPEVENRHAGKGSMGREGRICLWCI